MLDSEAAKEGFERDAKQYNVAKGMRNPNSRGFDSPRMRKCVAPIQHLMVPKGCSAVERRTVVFSG
jgi:hypothetical protein